MQQGKVTIHIQLGDVETYNVKRITRNVAPIDNASHFINMLAPMWMYRDVVIMGKKREVCTYAKPVDISRATWQLTSFNENKELTPFLDKIR